jgi:hypothetical protein
LFPTLTRNRSYADPNYIALRREQIWPFPNRFLTELQIKNIHTAFQQDAKWEGGAAYLFSLQPTLYPRVWNLPWINYNALAPYKWSRRPRPLNAPFHGVSHAQ